MRRGIVACWLVLGACSRDAPRATETAPIPPAGAGAPPSTPAAASASGATEQPPAGLACLARLYGGEIARGPAGFELVARSGVRLLWDDGRAKPAEERLDAPDLEDMLATPYPTGPIAKVLVVDHDPGRARVETLFEATYGDTEKSVRAALVPWKLFGHVLPVHPRALPAFERVGARLAALVEKTPTLAKYFTKPGGTFVFRSIAGTNRRSAHAFGIALDLDPSHSHYWRNDAKVEWKNAIPQAIVDAFESEQFVWGGRWWHYDTMHFEWRPELFACRAGG